MKKIDLEKYIVLSVENEKIQIVYNAENTDLYLWKYGSFYVTRDRSRIIPNCPDENILFLKKGEKISFAITIFLIKIIHTWYSDKNILISI